MAGARDLVLWLLDQGYQPQHLKPNSDNDPAFWVEICQEEINALETSGRSDLIDPFQQQLRNVGLEFQDPIIQETDIWMQHAVASAELTEELRQQLNQAIDLRNQGEGEASLALLEHLAGEGIRSPWLADNQARVLVNLQRKTEALEIWAALGRSPHSSVSEQAQAMGQQVKQATIQQLLDHATQIAARAEHNIQSEQNTERRSRQPQNERQKGNGGLPRKANLGYLGAGGSAGGWPQGGSWGAIRFKFFFPPAKGPPDSGSP